MCGAWRMCWNSTRSPTIRRSQSSASRRYPTRWWPRSARPCPKKAWTPAALRLRVRAQGYGQHLRVLRAQASMARPGRHRATYGGGFRLGYAAAGGRALPRSREGAGGPRQPKHSHPSLALQSVRAGGSQAHLGPAGVRPHPQARLLAEHGGDRALSVLSRQWMEGRIPDAQRLAREIGASRNRSATKEGRRYNGASRLRTLGRSWHAFTRHNCSGGVLALNPILRDYFKVP